MSGEFGLVIFGTLIPCSPKVKEMGSRLVLPEECPWVFHVLWYINSREIQVNPVVQLTLGTFRKRSIFQEEMVSSSKKPVFYRGHEPFILGGVVTLDALRDQLI